MILNAFSALAVFVALLRLAAAGLIVSLGIRALEARRRANSPEAMAAAEERYSLLFSLGVTLVALAVASWPLFYLVLQSYVGEWPGLLCVQGVTRIGLGSSGPVSHLPFLVSAMEWLKPTLILAAGAWLVLHVGRRGATGGVVALLLLCGGLALADGGAEMAYLFIPKKENVLATGCCGFASNAAAWQSASLSPAAGAPAEPHGAGLATAFFLLGGTILVLLTLALRRLRGGRKPGLLRWVSLLAAAASLPVGLAFLLAVGAPAFLHLPYHHCAYCLIPKAPESLVGIALYVLGAFAVAWGAFAGGTDLAARLLRFARFGYLAALLMVAVRLVVE